MCIFFLHSLFHVDFSGGFVSNEQTFRRGVFFFLGGGEGVISGLGGIKVSHQNTLLLLLLDGIETIKST